MFDICNFLIFFLILLALIIQLRKQLQFDHPVDKVVVEPQEQEVQVFYSFPRTGFELDEESPGEHFFHDMER